MCGFVLTDAHQPIHTVTRFEAQLAILDSKNIICAGYGAVMHVHTLAEECTLSALLHYYDKKTGKKSRRPPQFAKKGMKVVALLETAAPICVETCVHFLLPSTSFVCPCPHHIFVCLEKKIGST